MPRSSPLDSSELRYERKFEAHGTAPRSAVALLKLHPAHFREVYEARRVNSLYFDTSLLTDYHDHVSGAANRSKVRVRWYGEEGPAGQAQRLELKARRGNVGMKCVRSLEAGLFSSLEELPRAGSALRDEDSSWMREHLASRTPSLLNQYWRRYFVSADGRFRVTVDWGLAFQRWMAGGHSHRKHCLEHDFVVLELKYQPQDDRRADQVTARLPFRLSRLSKYVHGMRREGGFTRDLE